jgi:hypothetical protein
MRLSKWCIIALCILGIGSIFLAAVPPAGYHLLKKIPLGAAEGGGEYFEYITVDAAARRAYLSHGTEIVVLNLGRRRWGSIQKLTIFWSIHPISMNLFCDFCAFLWLFLFVVWTLTWPWCALVWPRLSPFSIPPILSGNCYGSSCREASSPIKRMASLPLPLARNCIPVVGLRIQPSVPADWIE